MKKVSKKGKVFFGLIGLLLVGLLSYIAVRIWVEPNIRTADKANASWAALENPNGVVSLYKDILLNESLSVNERFSEISTLVESGGVNENRSYQLYWLVMSETAAENEASGAMAGLLSFRETFENRLNYLAEVMHFCYVDMPTIYLSDKDQFKLILEEKISYKDVLVSVNWFTRLFFWLSVVLVSASACVMVWLTWKGFFNKKKENQQGEKKG